jgi:ribose transport system permease protein
VLFITFSFLQPHTFLTKSNLQSLLLSQAVASLVALAVLVPVVVGEFDLSVGYVVGFACVVMAALGGESHLPGIVTLLLGLLIGIAIGVCNGLLVAKFKINSLIATLGVGLAVSGLSVGASGSQVLSTDIPSLFATLARTSFIGLGIPVWIVIALAVVLYWLFVFTPVGVKMYATGGSERVARLAGVRTTVLKVGAFAAAGLIAAFAGGIQLGLSGAAIPTFGSSLLLPAFAAVFLGSTTVRPGHFNVGGTLIAILLLAVGFSGLSLEGVPFWTQPVFDGVVLIIGVLLSRSESSVAA